MPEPRSRRGNTGPQYSLVRALAAGGMGRVDLVARRDGAFFRVFAQKRLRPELVDEPEVRGMFLDEARIAGLLRHPNVVSVVDVGEDQAGPYLVMEFVEGLPLSQVVATARARGERLPIEVCLRLAQQVAEGLHAAHELRGADGALLCLVHRDVSPQNILVGFDGMARVTDFGIAKALGRTSKTSTGMLKGKFGYISPEQLRFEEPDRRADLFSLGVVLFEMLSGKRLYASQQELEGPRRILHEPPPDLAFHREDAEPELVELLFELLAKEREHRPADAKAVARRLETMLAVVIQAESVDTSAYLARLFAEEQRSLREEIARAALAAEPAAQPPRERRRWLALALAMAGGGAAVAALLGARRHDGGEARAAAAVAADDRASVSSADRAPSGAERSPSGAERSPSGAERSPSPAALSSGEPAAPEFTAPRATKAAPRASATRAPRSPASAAPRATKSSGVPVWESY